MGLKQSKPVNDHLFHYVDSFYIQRRKGRRRIADAVKNIDPKTDKQTYLMLPIIGSINNGKWRYAKQKIINVEEKNNEIHILTTSNLLIFDFTGSLLIKKRLNTEEEIGSIIAYEQLGNKVYYLDDHSLGIVNNNGIAKSIIRGVKRETCRGRRLLNPILIQRNNFEDICNLFKCFKLYIVDWQSSELLELYRKEIKRIVESLPELTKLTLYDSNICDLVVDFLNLPAVFTENMGNNQYIEPRREGDDLIWDVMPGRLV